MSESLYQKPDGSFVYVDDQYAQAARQKGYVPSTREQLDASKQEGRTFAEGLVRGASAGFAEPLITSFAEGHEGVSPSKARQQVAARREANPIAATTGEIGGALGASVLTGGGVSGLVGGGLKGAALEGGMYGMGAMVTDATLEDRDLTSDRLAAGLLGGVLAGTAIQGGFNLIGKGVSLGVSKFGGKGLKDALDNAASTIEQRALSEGFSGGVKKLKARGGSLEDVVRYAQREGLPIQFTDEALASVEGALQKTHGETSALMQRLNVVKPLNDKSRVALADEVQKQLESRFAKDPVRLREVESFMKNEIEPLIVDNPSLDWESVYNIQSSLRQKVGAVDTGIKKDVYEAGRKTLRNLAFAEAGAINPGVEAQLHRLQRDYATGSFLREGIANRITKNESSGGPLGLSLMDVVRGGGMGGAVGGAVGGPVGAALGAVGGSIVDRSMRAKGASFAANALRQLGDSAVLGGVSKGLAAHIGQVLAVAPEALGAFRFPLAQAAARGADALLEEHIRQASGPQGSAYLSTLGLPSETPQEVDAAGQRLAVLDALERATREQQAELAGAVDGIFGSAPGRKSSLGSGMSARDFKRAADALEKLVADPQVAFESIPPELRAGAPATTSEAAAKALSAAQFLHGKMPKSPYAGMPPSIAPQWEPSAAEIDRFNRYREAVENPANVLKNLARGYISPEQVEALRTVYPRIYSDLQQKIGERLMTLKKPPSYMQRQAIAAFVGPGALGMTPQQVVILQQSQAGAPSPQGAMKGPDGRQDVNEEQIQTEAQKLEAR